MKKRKTRKTKQQKVIDETFENVFFILKTAESALNEPVADRFHIHHYLLDMVPMVETILNGNGFTRTDDVIKRIRKVAEIVAPASHVAAYG